MNLHFVLLVAALACELLASLNVSSPVNLTAAGLACYFVTLLV